MDEFLADNERLSEYNRQVAENERSNQELQNYFNMLLEPTLAKCFTGFSLLIYQPENCQPL